MSPNTKHDMKSLLKCTLTGVVFVLLLFWLVVAKEERENNPPTVCIETARGQIVCGH